MTNVLDTTGCASRIVDLRATISRTRHQLHRADCRAAHRQAVDELREITRCEEPSIIGHVRETMQVILCGEDRGQSSTTAQLLKFEGLLHEVPDAKWWRDYLERLLSVSREMKAQSSAERAAS